MSTIVVVTRLTLARQVHIKILLYSVGFNFNFKNICILRIYCWYFESGVHKAMRLATALCVLVALVPPLSLAEAYNSTDDSRQGTQIGTSRVSSYTLPRWRGTAESFSGKDVPIPLPEVPEGALSFLSNFTTAEYGSSGVPFTTSGAYGSIKDLNSANLPTVLTSAPSDLRPWSATGKLSWDFGMFLPFALCLWPKRKHQDHNVSLCIVQVGALHQ